MSILKVLAKSDEESGSLGRHTILLASLVSLLVALPAFQSVPGGRLRFSILLCFVLTAAVYVHSRHRWAFVATLLLGGSAIASVAISEATGSMSARIASASLGLGLLSVTTLMMLNTLIRTKRVSGDTIVGGICVYLMIGLAFSLAYSLAITMDPNALMKGGAALASQLVDGSTRSAGLLYFSFVTLTTLGYGDITPSGELTQMLVTAEAIIGQLYLTIFIARLLSLYLIFDRESRITDVTTKNS